MFQRLPRSTAHSVCRSSRCFSLSWQALHRHCRLTGSQNNASFPRCGRLWSATSCDVSGSMRSQRLHVKRSRTNTDQRSFCQRLVLYQRRQCCVSSRKRLRCVSSPAWLAILGGSLPTRGLRVLSLANGREAVLGEPLFVDAIELHACLGGRAVNNAFATVIGDGVPILIIVILDWG